MTERDLAATILAAAAGSGAATAEDVLPGIVEGPVVELEPTDERPAETGFGSPQDEGIVRVFVSSTFRDMQAERDELARLVFPELRRRCRARGIEFAAIDLRWGITATQAARGEVLEICLDEIDRCRPFFVGILGSRYGWIPDPPGADALGDHPWLARYPGASVTELEWRHGVLNDPGAATAFFYFRRYDPAGEADGPGVVEPDEAPDRLASLEAEVRSAGLRARDDFASLEELGALVLDDLWPAIERILPPEGVVTDADRRHRAQRAFLDDRLRIYIDRPEYFARLDEHAGAAGRAPLLVSGGAGAGKSALLANWVDRRRRVEPEATVVFHSVTASPGSTDYRGLVRSVIEEIERTAAGSDRPRSDADSITEYLGGHDLLGDDALVPALGEKLARAAASGRVVLVLDGLDQMLDATEAADLLWLPELPENVAVIVAARAGRVADRVARSATDRVEVTPLTESERERMITEQLHVLHGKRLDTDQTRQIARAPQAANPLFLKTFLEELRALGSFERLDETITHYLAAESTGELVDRILERCERDYEPGGSGGVGAAMTAIWASSLGLAESEILALGGIPQAFWSPLRMALQESLVSYSGLVDFAHDEIGDAVAARYLPTPEDRRAAHRRLAGFFASQQPDGRTAVELLHQLDAAEDWEDLADALRDLPVLAEAWEIAKPDVWRHWEHVTGATGLTLADAYADVVARPADFDREHVWAVAALLSTMRQADAAIPLQRRLVEEARAGGNAARLQAALGNLGLSLFLNGGYDEALECHAEEEGICRRTGDGQELEMCLGNKANVLLALERWDEARRALDEAAGLCRRQGDTQQLGRRLASLAQLLTEQGDLLAAEAALREAVPILEAGRDHIALEAGVRRLNDLGVALKNAGHYDLADACYLNTERLARALGRPGLVASALMNRGVVLGRMRRTGEAITLLEEAEVVARGAGDPDVLMRCLLNRAGRLVDAGRAGEIQPLLEEAMTLARETGQTELLPDMEAMNADARSHLW